MEVVLRCSGWRALLLATCVGKGSGCGRPRIPTVPETPSYSGYMWTSYMSPFQQFGQQRDKGIEEM